MARRTKRPPITRSVSLRPVRRQCSACGGYLWHFYHEIVHHLIRRHDVLYAALDEQYRAERDLTNMLERLCDVGAAEFVLPAAVVRAATAAQGWTVALVEEMASGGASRVAACVQLVLLAPHRCVAVVCHLSLIEDGNDQTLWGRASTMRAGLQVDVAMTSPAMRFGVARWVCIPSEHVVTAAYEVPHGTLVRGQAPIPFRSGKVWIVECEAVCLGQQVFALFHVDPPPSPLAGQLSLFS